MCIAPKITALRIIAVLLENERFSVFIIIPLHIISSVTGEEMKTVIESLKGSIYQNPLHWGECYYKGWETSDEYLSGNLMHKLAIAQAANNEYPGIFDSNIKALKELAAPELETDEIYVTLGSPWVPTDIIDDFIKSKMLLLSVSLDGYKENLK